MGLIVLHIAIWKVERENQLQLEILASLELKQVTWANKKASKEWLIIKEKMCTEYNDMQNPKMSFIYSL